MKSLFKPAPAVDEAVPPVAAPKKGWTGLSAGGKLGVVGGISALAVGAVILPTGGRQAPAPTAPAEQHQPARISEYQAPPVAADVVPAAFGGSGNVTDRLSDKPARRYRGTPTEMALYSGKVDTAAVDRVRDGRGGQGDEDGTVSPRFSSDGDDKLGSQLRGATVLPTSKATLVRHPSYVIRAGDVIPCLPIDAQNSSRAGFTTCKVPEWFRSSDQRRGLLPPGTRIFGQVRAGLAQGEMRLGVLYTQIQTPRFNMALSAPAADAMGRSGLDGTVETFFWDRAGAVALYALMDVAVGGAQAAGTAALSGLSGGGNNILSLGSIGGRAQGLASQELAHRIDRPPVFTRDQALPMTVTVGQDLDFYDACRQAMQVDPMACPVL